MLAEHQALLVERFWALIQGFRVHAGARRIFRGILLTHNIAYMDPSGGEDLRAQAAPMTETFDHRFSCQALQMTTWFAKPKAADSYVADAEFATHQMIE